MKIDDIVANSEYLTDEVIASTKIVPIVNGAIAYINTETGTDLPFVTAANISTTDYTAITASWLLRLIEPYICFSIFSNDTTLTDAQFHYQRFLTAVDGFKKRGTRAVSDAYVGQSDNYYEIDTTNQTVLGWFEPTDETIEDWWS